MKPMELSWQNTKNQKIFAQDWRPQGEPRAVVVLVHGLGEHIGRYQYVSEQLNKAGIGLIGFDIAGHGHSEGIRGHASFEDVFTDIDCALGEAANRYPGKPRFIYGHSMGGALTLFYLLKRKPVLNGAVVTSPGLAPGEKVPPVKIMLAKVMSRLMPSFIMDNGLDLMNLSRDPQVVQAYKDDPLVHPHVSVRLGLDLLTRGSWILEHAAEFSSPLLLVQGSGDHIVSAQATAALAKAVPSRLITYKEWNGLYHETHNEPEKEKVLQFLIEWIVQHL